MNEVTRRLVKQWLQFASQPYGDSRAPATVRLDEGASCHRIKALLRRAGMENAAPLAAGRITLDIEEHTVQIAQGEPVRLTKLELRLLQMLLANAGHTVSSDRLLIQVWGHRNSGDRQLLKQLVHRLRQKIEVDPATPQLLQTASGAGYKLVVD